MLTRSKPVPVLGSALKQRAKYAPPGRRFSLILSLNRPLGLTPGLRESLRELGGEIKNDDPAREWIVVSLPASQVARLENFSDDIRLVVENSRVLLEEPVGP
jgi:hypothetical protein